MLQYAKGDLKMGVNELSLDDLTADSGGQAVYDLIQKNYADYFTASMPRKWFQAMYDTSSHRQRSETQLAYTSRRHALFREMKKIWMRPPNNRQRLRSTPRRQD